jgi:hypothetical protein
MDGKGSQLCRDAICVKLEVEACGANHYVLSNFWAYHAGLRSRHHGRRGRLDTASLRGHKDPDLHMYLTQPGSDTSLSRLILPQYGVGSEK